MDLSALLHARSAHGRQRPLLDASEVHGSTGNIPNRLGALHHSIRTSHGTANHFFGPATSLQTTNMLEAFTILIGIFHIAIDQAVSRCRFVAGTNRLAHVGGGLGTLNFSARFVCATGKRAHSGLHICIQKFWRGKCRRVYSLKRTVGSQAFGLCLHGRTGLFCHV